MTLTLAVDQVSGNESSEVQINHASIGAGSPITLTANISTGKYILNNAENGNTNYTLDVKRASAAGEQWFVHANVLISATDTDHIDYGTWDGTNALTIQIDHSSDGIIDETIILDNQVKRVYLPLFSQSLMPVGKHLTCYRRIFQSRANYLRRLSLVEIND